jgi:hypothetical protein
MSCNTSGKPFRHDEKEVGKGDKKACIKGPSQIFDPKFPGITGHTPVLLHRHDEYRFFFSFYQASFFPARAFGRTRPSSKYNFTEFALRFGSDLAGLV